MAGTDKIREEFEAWALANPDMTRATHFDVWKASREALVIELPEPRDTLAGPTLYAQFKAAVEASGAKVK